MIGKKSFAVGAALVVAGLTLPAFAFTSARSPESVQPRGAATAHRASATQLVVDTQYDQRTADPARDASISGRYILGSVYDTLTSFKARKVNGRLSVSLSEPVPWLAQSYKSNKAGNVWTFVLRKGVKFSNGDPLTAKDVVFSLLRVKNVNAAPAFVTNSFASVTAIGQYTVRIVTKQPNPAIPYLMAYKSTGVVDSTVAQQNGATAAADASTTDKAQTWFDTHSIGSGPYIFQTFSNSGDSVLVRNPKFWGPKPYYDRIVFRNTKPEIARLDVQSGQAQMALGLTPDQASSITGAKVFRAPSTTVFYLQANASADISPLAANPNLWEAVRYGLDYPTLVRLAGGGAVQACGVVPRQFLGALPKTACIKRNLTRARAALRRTGVANPSLTLEFPTDFTLEGVSFQTISEAVQSQLKEIGLDVTLRGAPLPTWLPRWMKGIQELNQGALAALYPDPNMTEAYLPTGYRGQYAGYKASDAPDLTNLGLKAQQTVNETQRAALYRQLQTKLNSASPFIPQFQPSEVVVAANSVKGVVINPAFIIDPPSLR
jgi:peptide/nickel transport system substrate-binding protein